MLLVRNQLLKYITRIVGTRTEAGRDLALRSAYVNQIIRRFTMKTGGVTRSRRPSKALSLTGSTETRMRRARIEPR